MKLFKYNQFINESNQNIDSICNKYGIKNYTINQDGSIDVDGNVNLSSKKLTKLPLKFRNVSGNFWCYYNRRSGGDTGTLTSLEGSPQSVGGNFDCFNNKLTSLEGSPQIVGGDFNCYNNQLKDVYGIKEGFRLGGRFYIENNPVYQIFKLFPKDRYDEVIEFLNEYNVIRDGNKVILQALEMVYDELGIEVPEEIEIEGYEIQF